MTVVVGGFKFRHVQKINATHKFAPAQYLADKAFHAGQVQPACGIGLLSR